MPNWTTNYVTLRHFSTKKIKALKEELKKEYPEILNHLRPQPDNIFTGNLGDKEREECIKKGIPNWYDWNCENWGTKWDARRVDLINETANTVDIQFDTAWSPPLEWFDYICSEGWRVHARYRDEGFMFVGVHKHGENLIIEKGEDLEVIETLGFSKCKVSIAVPKNQTFKSLEDLNGKRIATSYPNTVTNFLAKNKIKAELHIINGSVEIAPNIGLADAICDIVSSGSTLFKNNLKEVVEIGRSQAVLVQAPDISSELQQTIDKLRFRIQAVLRAKQSKYILLNAPNDKIKAISAILPVLKSPTVLPLAQEGWSSLHSVINESDFWEVIDQLKAAGAEDILVCPIEKMVL